MAPTKKAAAKKLTTLQKAGLYAKPLRDNFIHDMAVAGRFSADLFNYPLPAIIACACMESDFGTSDIFVNTGNPFNIQKPSVEFSRKYNMPVYEWPKCVTLDQVTVSEAGASAGPAPFCIAVSLQDAVRQFCEWVNGFPVKAQRNGVEVFRRNPVLFANALYKVGFSNNDPKETRKYGDLIRTEHLVEVCSEVLAEN